MSKSVAVESRKVLTYDPLEKAWTVMLEMPRSWCGHSGTGALGQVLIEAGGDHGQFHYSSACLDPRAGTKRVYEHLWGRRYQWYSASEAVKVGDEIILVVVGGFREGDSPTERVTSLRPTTGSWVAQSNTPQVMVAHTCFTFRRTSLYVVGGDGTAGRGYREYVAEEDVWREHTLLTVRCKGIEAEVLGEEVYVMGAGGVLQKGFEKADTWHVMTSPPCRTNNCSGLPFLDDIFFLLAHEGGTSACTYCRLSDSWSSDPVLTFPKDIPTKGRTFDWARD